MVTTLWNICCSIQSLSCGCGYEHDDDQDNICMVLCVLMEEHLCCDEDLLFSLFRFSTSKDRNESDSIGPKSPLQEKEAGSDQGDIWQEGECVLQTSRELRGS